MRVIAVIPAYTESQRIAPVIQGCRSLVDEVVVVDDGSLDETSEVAERAGARVFRHVVNRGQGAALRTGTEAALRLGADFIVHVDADGQHDPVEITFLIQPLQEGKSDIVFGSRFLEKAPVDMPLTRRVLLQVAKWFNALVMGIPSTLSDPQSGMRAFTRSAALALDFRQDRMAHVSEILRFVTRSSWRWQEVPIRVKYSSDSLAKGQKNLDALKIVWQLILGIFAS